MSAKAKTALLVLSLQVELLLALVVFYTPFSVTLGYSSRAMVAVVCALFVLIGGCTAAMLVIVNRETKPSKPFQIALPILAGVIWALLLAIAIFWPLMHKHIADLTAQRALIPKDDELQKALRASLGEQISANKELLTNLVFLFAALIFGTVAVMLIFINRERRLKNLEDKAKYFTSQNITRIAIMTSLSYILYMLLKIQGQAIPFLPPWLDIQFSDMPALLAGLMMDPIAGCLVVVFKILLKLPFSSTAYVGELGDLLIGLSLVLPASVIYKRKRCLKGAILGLSVGVLTSTILAMIINRFILVPFYVYLMFSSNFDGIVAFMNQAKYINVTADSFYTFYIFVIVLPFNLARGALTSLITFFVYKRLGKLFKKLVPSSSSSAQNAKRKDASSAILNE